MTVGTDGKTCDRTREPSLIGRRGFLALLGAGLGLAGLRAFFRGGIPEDRRVAGGTGNNANGGDDTNRTTSDVTARYWVRGDELAG